MSARIFKRAATSFDTDGRRWSEVCFVVERDVPGEPGTIEFHRYSSSDEALADAAQDLPTTRWEITEGVVVGAPKWKL